jgi:plasmid replication initiation protein
METKRDNRAQYRAAKAVSRLTTILPEMCKDFSIPEQKNSVNLRNLQRDTSKFASDAARTREEWLRQIRPYHILDMMTLGGNIDKLRRLGDELHAFLMDRGSVFRSLEEIDGKLESLNKLQGAKEQTISQRKAVEDRIKEAEGTDETLRNKLKNVRANPKMIRYLEVDSELRKLRSELIRTGFSRLGRPIKKLISMSERGDYPLPIEVRETAREYVSKPFATFLSEEDGYPCLKSVMQALSGSVSSGKLALKQREAKKVIERTDQVVAENSLAQIHESARKAKLAYDQCLSDSETETLVRQLRELRKGGKENQNLLRELRAELERAVANERQAEDQISALMKEIQGLARKLTGSEMTLQLAQAA